VIHYEKRDHLQQFIKTQKKLIKLPNSIMNGKNIIFFVLLEK